MRSLLIALLLAGSSPAAASSPESGEIDALHEGVRHLHARELEAAEAKLLSLAQADPQNPEVAFFQGRVYLAKQQAQDAVDAFDRAIRLDPEQSRFHFWLAEALVRRIDEVPFFLKLTIANRMRTAYEEATRLDPEDLQALISVARFHAAAPAMAGGSLEKAAAHLEAIRQRDPALAHVTQGLSHEQLGQLEAAESELRAAVELDADSIVSWRELGYFYQRRERWLEAREAFERVLAQEPKDPPALYEVGRLGVQISEQLLARSRETLNAYLEVEPGPGPMILGAAEPPSHALASRTLRQLNGLGSHRLAGPDATVKEQEPSVHTGERTDFPLIDAARVD